MIGASPVPGTLRVERGASAEPAAPSGNLRQLVLATGAFAVCFAAFGSLSAMMNDVSSRLQLTSMQKSVALALPVLLGSLGRIPMGMLADRLGGRTVFLLVLAGTILPVTGMAWVDSYALLLACGFLTGIPLACFPIGVAMVSGWYPPSEQGKALGIYGAGTGGQALASFGAPMLAGYAGYAWGFWAFSLLTALWLLLFFALAENPPRRGPARSLAEFARPLREAKSWELSLYYFLTFGGFVAMAIYLPIFLTDLFQLTKADAGLRTAGFVLLATAFRPLGGKWADRWGGLRVLQFAFPAVAVFAIFMACPSIYTFTVGALGMAIAIGLGNGAVFKLVPEYFPTSVGTVTGLVGAAGGLGGFFPPLVVGAVHQLTGAYWGGFLLLAGISVFCLIVCARSSRRLKRSNG